MKTKVEPQDPNVVKKRIEEKEVQRNLSFEQRNQSPRQFRKRESKITLVASGFSKKTD